MLCSSFSTMENCVLFVSKVIEVPLSYKNSTSLSTTKGSLGSGRLVCLSFHTLQMTVVTKESCADLRLSCVCSPLYSPQVVQGS